MARKIRIEFAGAVYHVMARGDHGERIFQDDQDRETFLFTLGDTCTKTGWRVHAFVLMDNHYHLLLETPEPNLVAGMKWLQSTFTRRYNLRHQLLGHLFQGRYRALIINPDEPSYFGIVSTYIHLNPARAGLIRIGEKPLRSYRWSSYPHYLAASEQCPPWLQTARVLGSLAFSANDRSGRRGYAAYMEGRALESSMDSGRKNLEEQWQAIRRGWYLGEDSFRDRLLKHVGMVFNERQRSSYSGDAKLEHDVKSAETRLRDGLSILGISEERLRELSKGAVEKQALVWWLGHRTVVPRRWICERLHMGDPSRVTQAIREAKKAHEGPLPALIRKLTETTEVAEASPSARNVAGTIPEFLD